MLSIGAESFVLQFAVQNLQIEVHRNANLRVVLYGCETWSFTLWEECRLRVFENRVLRRIFGTKRDEVTGEWRKLHMSLFIYNPHPILFRRSNRE